MARCSFAAATLDSIKINCLVLADGNRLRACQLTPPGVAPVKRRTALRGFDLTTSAQKLRWDLPGDDTTCNEFSIGPDSAEHF